MLHEIIKRLTVTLLLLHLRFKITAADLVLRPRDTESLVNFPSFFNCTTTPLSGEVQWFHYADGENKQRRLVYGYNQTYAPYQSRFQVEKNDAKGEYNLVITSVTTDDAGKYQCQDDFGRGAQGSAQLIVLDSLPVCESNMNPQGVVGPNTCGIEPEPLKLTCSVRYRGNQPPSMNWKRTGSDAVIAEGVTTNTSTNQVTYELTLNSISLSNGASYECMTTNSATEQLGCTSEVVKLNGSNLVSYALFAVLAFTILLLFVTFGLCVKLLIEKRTSRAKKLETSTQEYYELLPIDKNKNENEYQYLEQRESEIQRLRNRVADLEELFYRKGKIQYINPQLVHTTEVQKAKTEIRGIAISNGELFAVFEFDPEIKVYDTVTFVQKESFTVTELWDPQDIASCKINHCLYIIHQKQENLKSQILRLDTKGKILHEWSLDCGHGRLSTHESSVVVCISEQKKIIEYSPDGAVLCTVRLSPADGFDRLWHAIKVTGTHFVVSDEDTKNKNRLCLVDSNGHIISNTTNLGNHSMNMPICLTEDGDKYILVSNAMNSNVVLLSTDFQWARKLIEYPKKEYGIRICLDETGYQLFVAINENDPSMTVWQSGRISIYNVRSK